MRKKATERTGVAAAQMIVKLWRKYPEPRDEKVRPMMEECLAAFKAFDFRKSYQAAERAF